MTMTYIWCGMIIISLIYGVLSGNFALLGNAAADGAKAAIQLSFELCGITCLWCGIMKVFENSGILNKATELLRPLICLILPETKNNKKAAEYAAANFSANLLGLGNAATPMGLKAIAALHDGTDRATNDMCTFTVLNSASIQLIPITVAAVRSANGANAPFDILPAVWITSFVSAAAGVLCSKAFSKLG